MKQSRLSKMLFEHKPLNQRPYVLLTLAVFFWALNLIVGRAVHGVVPPVGLAFWRWTVSALIVLCLSHQHLRRDWPLIRRDWKILLLLSAVGIGAYNTLLYIGLQSTTAINGLLLQATMPLMIVLISFVLFRERITIREAFGIAVALCGAIIIVLRGNWHHLTAFSSNPGDLWIFTAILCYALYSSLLRLRPLIHPLSLLAVTFAVGAILLLPLYIEETLKGHPVVPNARTALAVGYVAVFPSIVSFLCFNRGVELVGANRAGLFMYLMPLFGSLLAVLFLGEHFQHYDLIGFALIIMGIGLQRINQSVKSLSGGDNASLNGQLQSSGEKPISKDDQSLREVAAHFPGCELNTVNDESREDGENFRKYEKSTDNWDNVKHSEIIKSDKM